MKRTEIIFIYHDNYRCHAKIVKELSVEPNSRTYVGNIDGYEIYKTFRNLFIPDYMNFEFEAIKAI